MSEKVKNQYPFLLYYFLTMDGLLCSYNIWNKITKIYLWFCSSNKNGEKELKPIKAKNQLLFLVIVLEVKEYCINVSTSK